MGEIIHWLAEYLWLIVFGIILLSFFFRKSTRKTAFRILGIAVLILTAFAGVMTAGLHFWGERFLVLFGILLFHVPLVYGFSLALTYLIPIVSLHKHGIRINGTVVQISYGNRGRCTIRYTVDGKDYACETDRVKKQWKNGSEIPILYDEQNPQKSCAAKHDLVSGVALIIGAGGLLIASVIITIVMLLVSA